MPKELINTSMSVISWFSRIYCATLRTGLPAQSDLRERLLTLAGRLTGRYAKDAEIECIDLRPRTQNN